MPGAGNDDKLGERQDFAPPIPRLDFGERVGTDQESSRRRESLERVEGIAAATARGRLPFAVQRLESQRLASDASHFQTIRKWRTKFFVRGIARGHENDAAKTEPVASLGGDRQVSLMYGIERPTEQ